MGCAHYTDLVMPEEADNQAAFIAGIYGEEYIDAYGVYMDIDNIHIHLVIGTISWKDGNLKVAAKTRQDKLTAEQIISIKNDLKKLYVMWGYLSP